METEIERRHATELQQLDAAAAAAGPAASQQTAAAIDGPTAAVAADKASKYLKDMTIDCEEADDAAAGGKAKVR
jgi:hypothetical protein